MAEKADVGLTLQKITCAMKLHIYKNVAEVEIPLDIAGLSTNSN